MRLRNIEFICLRFGRETKTQKATPLEGASLPPRRCLGYCSVHCPEKKKKQTSDSHADFSLDQDVLLSTSWVVVFEKLLKQLKCSNLYQTIAIYTNLQQFILKMC